MEGAPITANSDHTLYDGAVSRHKSAISDNKWAVRNLTYLQRVGIQIESVSRNEICIYFRMFQVTNVKSGCDRSSYRKISRPTTYSLLANRIRSTNILEDIKVNILAVRT